MLPLVTLFKRVGNYLPVLILVLSLIVAAALRWQYVAEIKCNYLSDCGRDLLAAKHIAEGTASLLTSPASAVTVLPNTPLYYWILAICFKIGGLIGISIFNLIIGVLVVWLTYLIVLELTQDEALGSGAALLIAVAPHFIDVAATTWQPNWQFFFGGLSIWLCLRALRTGILRWHFAAAASLWPLIWLEYLALPVAALISVWLILSWWQHAKTGREKRKTFGLVLALILTWLAWLFVVVALNPPNTNTVIKNQIGQIDFSVAEVQLKIRRVALNLVDFFTDYLRYFSFWQWLLPAPIGIALHRWWVTKKSLEKTQIAFLLTLFASLFLAFFEPAAQIHEWHFMLQEYVFLLIFYLSFYYLKLARPIVLAASFMLIATLFYQNRFELNHAYKAREPKFSDATAIARAIATDLTAQGLLPDQFRMVHRNVVRPVWSNEESDKNLVALAMNYETAGVQLALELLDDRFTKRISVVPSREMWSNYRQSPASTYYVICSDFTDTTVCAEDLFSPDHVSVKKTFLDPLVLPSAKTVYLYRLMLQTAPDQSK